MIVTQQSNSANFDSQNPQAWVNQANIDFKNLFLCLQGRTRFGDNSATNKSGENIDGQFITYTTNSTVNTMDTIAHTLGSVPVGFIVICKSGPVDLYGTPAGDGGVTPWTSNNLYLKATMSSVKVTLFLLQ